MQSKWEVVRRKLEAQMRMRGLDAKAAARAAGVDPIVMQRFAAGIANGVPVRAVEKIETWVRQRGR